MIKTLPWLAVILFFTSCNNHQTLKPDADRVIKDTFAFNSPSPFNHSPAQQSIYVSVEPKQEKFLCARNAGIKKLMADLKSPAQQFVINSAQPNEITAQQGTRLSFKSNAFVSAEGVVVSAPVVVEVKECYTIEAMLQNNLLTAGNGGFCAGKGMLYVNAFAGGKPLQLQNGESMHVQFPFDTKADNGYHFMFGHENADGLVAWQHATAQANDGKVAVTGNFEKPVFSFQGSDLKAYLHQNLSYPDEAKRNELSAKVEVSFTIDETGHVTDVASAESYKIFRQAIEQSLKNMPVWTAAQYNGRAIASSVHVNIDFNIRNSEQVQIAFSDEKASLVNNGNSIYLLYGSDLTRSKDDPATAHAFTQLGWYNYCAALKTGKQQAEVIVCNNEASEVRLLMKSHAVILGGENSLGHSDFKNLAVGEDAYVVAVRYDAGNMYYAIQAITIQKQTVVALNWQKGNGAELSNIYNRLGKNYLQL